MAEQATQVSQAQTSRGAPAPIIIVNDSERIKNFVHSIRNAEGNIVQEPTLLKPGANRIDKETYERHAKDFKTDDRIWVLDKSFSTLSERDAEALAKQTIDVSLLRAFASVEKRKRPLAALTEQIDACAKRASGPAKSDSETDD